MNRQGHVVFSLTASVIIYFILEDYFELHFAWFLAYLPLILIGTLMPDILESASNPHHRMFFHSKRMLKILLLYVIPMFSFSAYFINSKYWAIVFFFIGYCLHLIPDSWSKMGLPN